MEQSGDFDGKRAGGRMKNTCCAVSKLYGIREKDKDEKKLAVDSTDRS